MDTYDENGCDMIDRGLKKMLPGLDLNVQPEDHLKLELGTAENAVEEIIGDEPILEE